MYVCMYVCMYVIYTLCSTFIPENGNDGSTVCANAQALAGVYQVNFEFFVGFVNHVVQYLHRKCDLLFPGKKSDCRVKRSIVQILWGGNSVALGEGGATPFKIKSIN